MLENFQSMSVSDCTLQEDRIDIWELPLDPIFPTASTLLNQTEEVRAKRYHFDRHRRRFTMARAFLRLILARYIQEDAKTLEFNYREHGKPELVNSNSLEFNLSHSRDLALVAVGQQFPLGIDLEFFSARPYDGIAKHLFSKEELDYFLALPNFLKPQIFFHLWSQKEAFIKATGLGLSYPTKLVTVPTYLSSEELIQDSVHHSEWLVNSFMPQIACSAALCRHPDVKIIRYLRINHPEELFRI